MSEEGILIKEDGKVLLTAQMLVDRHAEGHSVEDLAEWAVDIEIDAGQLNPEETELSYQQWCVLIPPILESVTK